MLESKRLKLIEEIESLLSRKMNNKKDLVGYVDQLESKYGMNPNITTTIINLSSELKNESDGVLFCIADVLGFNVKDYFTTVETSGYAKNNFKESKSINLTYKMVQIKDDQWIGKITAREIGKLSDSLMLRYNTNTQRPLTLTTMYGIETYKITINKAAVDSIYEAFKKGIQIPTTITLNVPQDQTFPAYNENTMELKLDDLQYFEVLDGYHRYLAINRLLKEDKNFDCEMELRIVSFSEEKARYFIYQEDQKTKMSKTDSDSFNVYAAENKIVNLLKQKPNLTELIKKDGIIDESILAKYIKKITTKNMSAKDIFVVKEKIATKIEKAIMDNPTSLEVKWSEQVIKNIIVE